MVAVSRWVLPRAWRAGTTHARVWAALLACATVAPCSVPVLPQRPQSACAGPFEEPVALPAEFEGAIKHVVLQKGGDSFADLVPPFRDLLRYLPPDVKFTIVCDGDAARDRLRSALGAAVEMPPGRVTFTTVRRDITVWARDRLIAARSLADPDRIVLLVPKVPSGVEVERLNEVEVVAPALVQGRPGHFAVQPVPLFLEGGNILAARRHVFVGRSLIDDNIGPATPTPLAVRNAVERAFGKPVIVVGETFREELPSDHIDMFMTVVDDRTVVVGRRVELPARWSGLHGREAVASPPGSTGAAPDHVLAASAVADDACDLVARELRRRGFRVVRIPIHPDRGGPNFVTFNNALLDHRDGRKTAYVPAYGLRAMERDARGVYASLGFEVRFIDVRRIHVLEGAVRCLANVVERDAVPMSARFGSTSRCASRPTCPPHTQQPHPPLGKRIVRGVFQTPFDTPVEADARQLSRARPRSTRWASRSPRRRPRPAD